ncbi:MAG: hypothetical protein HY814_12080 [Candidatus Riflebacteria bacterium]|nr:hypothetical protein [Candidatus Riflebacteria bacterium]
MLESMRKGTRDSLASAGTPAPRRSIDLWVQRPGILGTDFTGHILFSKGRDGIFCGICLDHSIIVQGKDLEEAEQVMAQTLTAFLDCIARKGEFHRLNNPSPQQFWDDFYRGRPVGVFQVRQRPPKQRETTAAWPLYRIGAEARIVEALSTRTVP